MLALPIYVSACLRMQVPESILPASESFLDKESGGTVTKMVPFVLDGPRYVDGSQEYAIWVSEEVERIYIGDNMQTEPPSVIFVQILVGAGDWIEWNVCAVNSLGDAGEPSPRCESISARLYVPC
jgi:hypothetical protein